MPAMSSKSSAVPIARVQLPPWPSAMRATHVPAVRLRRYPRLTPGAIRINIGFLAIRSFSRGVRCSSVEDLILLGMSYGVPLVSRRQGHTATYEHKQKLLGFQATG